MTLRNWLVGFYIVEYEQHGDDRATYGQNPPDYFRNPYMLEFLKIAEKVEFSENELETAVINHLQDFLLELGPEFCFEARQK